jgi:flagellar motility protein MotE (MotC chaperone)
VKELEQRNGESTVEAFAWDVETNTRQVKIFQVKHERHTKKGSYRLEDPRDIYEAVANQGARRLRACILGIVPGDVIEAAQNQCEQTLKAKADTSPEALKKLVEAFAAYKVTKEQIEKRIQRHLDTITPAQLIQLRKIYNSMKDGMSGPSDWFEMAPEKKEVDASSLKEKVKGKVQKVEEEMCPSECPEKPGTIYRKDYCDKCGKRVGCPAWRGNNGEAVPKG